MDYYSESGLEIFYGTDGAAGLDLPYIGEDMTIYPGERVKLPTGIYVELPEGTYGRVDSRSSTSKRLLVLLCSTIDEDYRGEINLVFTNVGNIPQKVKKGEYLGQLIIQKYMRLSLQRVNDKNCLSHTKRGEQGFGSTKNTSITGL